MKRTLILAIFFILHCCRFVSRIVLSGCLAALGSSFILAQGPLTPPGAPAPTIAQVEPRIEINATNTPGDADSLFRIPSLSVRLFPTPSTAFA